MDESSNQERAVELLQELGLKEYEAKCFVALSRLPRGTAKEISQISDVPRTRVYDAVRVLETKGLVEVQHSNPQQFRAVGIDEAARTLRSEYEARTENLVDALRDVPPADPEGTDVTHEVWALSGAPAIRNRTRELVADAEDEVLLVVGGTRDLSEGVIDVLTERQSSGVPVVVGALTDDLHARVEDAVPGADVVAAGLEWLTGPGEEAAISRLLLVDRNTILVSSIYDPPDAAPREQAVFGDGSNNGLVVITRRLLATELFPREPASD